MISWICASNLSIVESACLSRIKDKGLRKENHIAASYQSLNISIHIPTIIVAANLDKRS